MILKADRACFIVSWVMLCCMLPMLALWALQKGSCLFRSGLLSSRPAACCFEEPQSLLLAVLRYLLLLSGL